MLSLAKHAMVMVCLFMAINTKYNSQFVGSLQVSLYSIMARLSNQILHYDIVMYRIFPNRTSPKDYSHSAFFCSNFVEGDKN